MIGFYVFFFVLGTAFGSFLNVIIFRIKTKDSILKTRSQCLFCKKKLTWYELVPIVSFFIQRGKCRKCRKKISWQYPLVEFFTGLSFLLIIIYFFNFSFFSSLITIYYLVITSLLIVIFVYDLKHYLVPDEIIYPAIIIAGVWQFISGIFMQNMSHKIWNAFLAGLIGGCFFLLIVLISKGKWMGVGDVKIGLFMGLFLGLSNLFVALFLAFLSGAIISSILLILKKRNLKSQIPFGPFLTAATFAALLWGNVLIEWYFSFFSFS